jgi:uncharacterized protein YukE
VEGMGLALSALQTSERLEINSNTLRSHSIFLEGKGYRFIRDTNNRRIYHEKDLEILQPFIYAIREEKLTKEQAAEKILGYVEERQVLPSHNASVITLNASVEDMIKGVEMLSEHVFELTNELKDMKEKQQALNAQWQKKEERYNTSITHLEKQHQEEKEKIQQLINEVHELNQKLENVDTAATSKRSTWWRSWFSK